MKWKEGREWGRGRGVKWKAEQGQLSRRVAKREPSGERREGTENMYSYAMSHLEIMTTEMSENESTDPHDG